LTQFLYTWHQAIIFEAISVSMTPSYNIWHNLCKHDTKLVMYTEIVSNIIAWCQCLQRLYQISSLMSCLEIASNISLVSCIQRLCQIFQTAVMFTQIVSNIIAWCHVYRDYFKEAIFVSMTPSYNIWHNLCKLDTKL
jgi:hypothetical protein